MKGVVTEAWGPGPIVALIIIPLLLLGFVTVIAIKCTSWGPSVCTKVHAWSKPESIRRHKKNQSDTPPNELDL